MPQKRPEGTPEAEIDEWARRMIHDVEDLDYTVSRQDWMEFVNNKLFWEKGAHGSDAQLAALDRGRFAAVGMYDDLGIHREQPFVTRPTQVRYRDVATGRWASQATIKTGIDTITGRIK